MNRFIRIDRWYANRHDFNKFVTISSDSRKHRVADSSPYTEAAIMLVSMSFIIISGKDVLICYYNQVVAFIGIDSTPADHQVISSIPC